MCWVYMNMFVYVYETTNMHISVRKNVTHVKIAHVEQEVGEDGYSGA
jgi:hypothetical protein